MEHMGCDTLWVISYDFFMDIHNHPRHGSWRLYGKFKRPFCSGVLGWANLNDPHKMLNGSKPDNMKVGSQTESPKYVYTNKALAKHWEEPYADPVRQSILALANIELTDHLPSGND